MNNKPAAHQNDAAQNGGLIQGSNTVSAEETACSACPDGVAADSPIDPSRGAKVLSNEIDFALPSAAMPLVWARTYSSHVDAEHGGACGVLGYGWHLESCSIRLDVQAERALLFDAAGRTITFPAPLLPGSALYHSSEKLWLLRGGENAPNHNEAAWRHVPPDWVSDPDSIVVTSSDRSLFLRFSRRADQNVWPLTERRDRLGNSQRYKWVPSSWAPSDEALPALLLGEIDDGAGRRYRLHYVQHHPARPAAGPGWREQAGWLADSGWRLTQVELLETLDGDSFPNESARKTFEAAQTALKYPNILTAHGLILVRYDYDKHTGDLIQVRDRANTVTCVFSARNHLLVSCRHRGGPLYRYEYEADEPGAKIIEQHGGLDYRFTYFEDQPGLSRTVIRDSLEREQTYTFEGEGNLKRLVTRLRADGSLIRYAYDADGHLIGITNPLGRKTKMHRDKEGRLIGLEGPARHRTRTVYNETGQPIEYEEAARLTRYQYDAWGRLASIAHSDGTREAFQYPEPGQSRTANLPIRLIDARGEAKHLEWNSAGKLVSYTDCSNKTTRYHYSFWGGLLAETDALGQSTRFERDQTDKLLSMTLPDSSLVRYEYDTEGHLTDIIEPDGSRQRFVWDVDGQLIESIDAAEHRQRYHYDPAGRLIALENENGARASFEYDIMDRLIREIGFDLRVQRYRYDLLGQLTDKIEESLPTHPTIRYDYDEAGNMAARHLPANGPIAPLTERFEWNAQGQLISVEGGGGKIEFEYDEHGQPCAETQTQMQPDGRLWQWKHHQKLNELGVKQRCAYGELPPIDWLTYGSGHLFKVDLLGFTILFESDDLHREIRRSIRTAHSKRLFFNETAYNALGKVSERTLKIGGSIREKKRYRYDPLGRLIEIDDAFGARIRYTYNKADGLTSSCHGARTFRYAFDAAGNRIDPRALAPDQRAENPKQENAVPAFSGQSGFCANRLWINNRIERLDDIQNTFDAAGNLIRQKRPDGATLELHYDGAFRLTALTRTHPDGTRLDAWYKYDAFSRRIAKGVTEHGIEKVTRYGWDGNLLVHEATQECLTTILYPPGSFVPLARIEQDSGVRRVSFFVTDHAGTPNKLIDEEGQIIWEAEPDDWAAVRNEKGVRQPIRFQGQWMDEESGLHYNRYRYYDPKLGRYITQDPIGLKGGMNPFAYVDGNPVSDIDPMGLVGLIGLIARPLTIAMNYGGVVGVTDFSPRPPSALPYDPTFTSCAHYSGNTLQERILRRACDSFGTDPNSNCARKCLHDKLPSNRSSNPPLSWYLRDHPVCWYECGWPKGWR